MEHKITAERKIVIQKIVKLVIDEMEEKEKGNLTSIFVIRLLEEAIRDIESIALMQPVYYSLKFES